MDQKELSYLILGSRGGANRVKILKLLRDRPYNINQLATILGLNYRTVQHHIDVLEDHDIVRKFKNDSNYGELYSLDIKEGQKNLLWEVVTHFEKKMDLDSITNSLGFLSRIISQTSEGIIVFDRDWKVFFCNSSTQRTFGYELKEIIGMDVASLFETPIHKHLKQTGGNRVTLRNLRIRIWHKNGKLIDTIVSIDAIKDETRQLIGYVAMMRNVSHRKKMEEKIKWTLDRYKFLFNDAPSFNIILDENGHILEMNKTALRSLGYSKKLLRERKPKLHEISNERSKRSVKKLIDGILKGDFRGKIRLELKSKNDSKRMVTFISGKLIPDSLGHSESLILIGEDCTEIIELETNMEKVTKEKNIIVSNLQILAGSSPVGIVFVDAPDGKISYMNEKAKEIYGKSESDPQRVEHTKEYGLYRLDGRKFNTKDLPASRALFGEETVEDEEAIIHRSDGSKVHIMVNATPIRDEKGKVFRSIALFWDISELKKVKQALELHQKELLQQNLELRKSQEELELSRNDYSDLFDESHFGLFKLDKFGIIKDMNSTGATILKIPRKHVLDRPFVNIFEEDEYDIIRKFIHDVQENNKKSRMKTRIIHQDGEQVEVLLIASLVKKKNGSPSFCYVSMLTI